MKTKLPYLFVFLFIFFISNVYAGDPEAVSGIICSHMENSPSNTTTIDVEWSVPNGYTGFYYYKFTQASEYTTYTFDEDNISGLPTNTNGQTVYNHPDTSDETYYFHVAAVWENEDEDLVFGPTTTYGPIIIDITPPDGNIDAPSSTTSRNVTLSFVSSDAINIYVSNVAYGGGAKLDLSANNPLTWELTENEGTKRIYVRFLDRADNPHDTFVDIDYYLNTNPMIAVSGPQYMAMNSSFSIPFEITDTEGGNLTVSVSSDNQTLLSQSGLSITGIGGISQGNEYTVTTAASEKISLTLTLNPENSKTGSSILTFNVVDTSSGSASSSFTMNVYRPGDINQDGEVTMDDVRKSLHFIMGAELPTTLEYHIANRVDDGDRISWKDLYEIFKIQL
jgi:hypothetical protein